MPPLGPMHRWGEPSGRAKKTFARWQPARPGRSSNRLAAIAVHLRERQAQATDTESTPPARSQAQADVDKLLTLRNKTSEEVELFASGAPETKSM